MNNQTIRAAALISAELHIKNELEYISNTSRSLAESFPGPISGYLLNKFLVCFENYIEKGESIPAKTFEYRIDDGTIGVKSKLSLLDLLLSEDHKKDPI
jgi:hypothetical protein